MALVKVAKVADIGVGKMIGVKVKNKAILIANIGGKLHAMNDVCTHSKCGLSRGTLEGAVVTCPCHGSKFDARDGKVIGGPAATDELAFKVKIDGKDVFVDA